MEYEVTIERVSEDLNETLNRISGISDMNPKAVEALLKEIGCKTPTVWIAGCGYCWIEEEGRWVRCCIA